MPSPLIGADQYIDAGRFGVLVLQQVEVTMPISC